VTPVARRLGSAGHRRTVVQSALGYVAARSVESILILVGLLGELPYRPLSEPALAILGRQVPPGAHWTYPDPAGQPSITPQD